MVKMQHKFPQGFLWDGTIITNQVNGGFRGGRKSISIADFHPYRNIENRDDRKEDSTIRNGENFLVIEPDLYYPKQRGAGFYHRFEKNLGLMEGMGFKAPRTSFDWNHIYPKGDKEEPSGAGLRYYDRLITSIRPHGMEPFMTISHYEMPMHLVKKYGGWLNRNLVGFFTAYRNTLFERYHGQIKYWIVFSQINLTTFSSLGALGNRARNFMEAECQGVHHQFLAYARAKGLAEKYKGQVRVGTMLSDKLAYPAACRPGDMLFDMRKSQMQYFFPNAQLRGSYSAYTFRFFRKNHINIHVDPEDERLLRENPMDFLSTSYYYTKINNSSKNTYTPMDKSTNPYLEETEWDWGVDPAGLRVSLNHYSDRYPEVPIYIAENGYGAVDRLEKDGTVHDLYRVGYSRQHVIQMREAIADGVSLKGHIMQALMDIVSCSSVGMKRRYGLIYVDQDDEGNGSGQRYRKGGFYWYQKVIKSNGEEL